MASHWTIEPAERQFPLDWPAEGELWCAIHAATGTRILMAFDSYGYMLRARKPETCSDTLLAEAVGIFGDYLKESPIARYQYNRNNTNPSLS